MVVVVVVAVAVVDGDEVAVAVDVAAAGGIGAAVEGREADWGGDAALGDMMGGEG